MDPFILFEINNFKAKYKMNPITNTQFDLSSAISWWENKCGECRSGHFNLSLYLDYLKKIYQ